MGPGWKVLPEAEPSSLVSQVYQVPFLPAGEAWPGPDVALALSLGQVFSHLSASHLSVIWEPISTAQGMWQT